MGISLSYFGTTVLRIILFLFLTTALQANTNNAQEQTREACRQLMDEAWKDIGNKHHTIALEKLLRAEVMASENYWDNELWIIKNRIGIVYGYISNFGEALDYFQESYAITQKNEKLYEQSAIPLSSIGVLYDRESRYEDALHYMTRAYEILKKTERVADKKNTANNIASIYNKLDMPDKSIKMLLEVEERVGDKQIDFIWQVIYIETLFKNGQVSEARELAEKLYEELNIWKEQDRREECYTCLVSLLSQIYTKQNKIDLAILYANKGLKSNEELIDRIKLYESISDLYLQKNEYQVALQYKDSVLQTTDSLSARINRNLYEANKVKFKVQEYQNELKRKEVQQKLYITVIIFSLMLSFLIYKGLRNKVIKQKQKAVIANLELEKERKEHLLAEKELETTRLKQQQLKHEIAEKNRELSAKTLYLSNRNELIQDIISSLETNNKVTENKETIRQIKTIKTFLKTDDQRDDFMKHFESVNPSFLKRLKKTHPQLTSNDTRFLCYIFMNLSLKEISAVFSITYNACIIRKQRIMDKMGLDKKDVSLYDYVLNLSSQNDY